MTIDIYAIRERVSRPYGWLDCAGAPEPVRKAAAEYQAVVNDLDDALVAYEIEEGTRRGILKKHNDAVTEALREGKKPPPAKVPSLEELEVRHGAIVAAREKFVREAADAAERVAQEHYPQWRNEAVEQMQTAADAAAEALTAAADAVSAWRAIAGRVARLDRNWAPRTVKLDSAGLLDQIARWEQVSGVEAGNMASTAHRNAARLRQLSGPPIITEYDPAGGLEQYSAEYLAEQSPGVREDMLRRSEAS